MTDEPIRVALVGAGYIARWHADALKAVPGVRPAAVVDPSAGAAEGLAQALGVPAFASVEALIEAGVADAAHVLTPPDRHAEVAIACLEGGLHTLVEKPLAEDLAQVDAMRAAAGSAGKALGVGHNFLGLPGYARLKAMAEGGELGRISSAEVHWHLPLAPLRSGPFGLWMLRARRNLLLELGPHLFAFAHDLFGPVEVLSVVTGHEIELPGGAGVRPQSWRILARAGTVELVIALSTVEVADDRSLTVRGSSGVARLDYAADVLTLRRENVADLVVNPLIKELANAGWHLREGVVNAARQAVSLNRRGPYALSFQGMVEGFYRGVREGVPDPRFSAEAGRAVMAELEAALELLPAEDGGRTGEMPAPAVQVEHAQAGGPADAVVIGGTGFIGQHLTRGLVARGQRVRVLSRGRHGPFGDLGGMVETRAVSLRDEDGLARAMEGARVVFNLAKSLDKTWAEALENDVGTALRVARASQRAGAERLVYTGTIASYDMSDPGAVITEATGFAPDMSNRNLYARSKAECERQLRELHEAEGIGLSIARPGIVLGRHGPLQHWGIGRWHGAGAVRVWGAGRNILPFVLIDDVVEGLIAMSEEPAAVGESFNLVGEPMWTARDYFDAIHRIHGARLRVAGGNMRAFWAADALKYALKRHALGQRDAVRASLRDWKSRAHYARFDNSWPKRVLGWRPEADPEAFAARAVSEVDLFGF